MDESNRDDLQPQAESKLIELIAEAVRVNADSVEIEYCKEGGLEVCFMWGHTGGGGILVPDSLSGAVMGLISDKAGLERKPRGTMQLQVPITVYVEQYDTFGETAFRLFLRKPERKKRRRR